MVRYEDHSKDLPKIKKAIKIYLASDKSQDVCAEENNIKLSVFRYYYHNAKFMEVLKEEINSNKKDKEKKPQQDPEELMREIFSKNNNNNDKNKRTPKETSSSVKKIKTLSEKSTEDLYQRPPSVPRAVSTQRSNSANKFTKRDSNIDINNFITKPTSLHID
jgi:hypothetical protein